MERLRNLFFVTLLLTGLSAVPAVAEMSKGTGHGKSGDGHHAMKHGKKTKMGHKGGHRSGHLFGPHWKGLLTDSQRTQIDKMHLEVKKSTSVMKAQLKVKKIELANLIIQDDPNTGAIHRKIDGILELKGKIMKIKYDHKVEMRGIMTPEQRVSFDMGIVGKASSGKGHGKGH